jgi:predicted secreted protein
MNIASFIVVYVIAWLIVFFMLLPVGVTRDEAPRDGNDTGAPVNHMIGKKILWTSLIAAALLLIYWGIVDFSGFSLRPE